jgi:hypothetical protein
MLKDYKKCQTNVMEILEKRKQTRDSDKKLWLSYLYNYCGLDRQSLEKVAQVVLDPSTPTMESITRARRKIQERHPELRGKTYKQRQAEQENVRDHFRGN